LHNYPFSKLVSYFKNDILDFFIMQNPQVDKKLFGDFGYILLIYRKEPLSPMSIFVHGF